MASNERSLSRRRTASLKPLTIKDERVATLKKVAAILHKSEELRSPEEVQLLSSCSDVVKEVNLRQQKRDRVKARLEEIEDPPEVLEEKCMRLAGAISRATSLAVYTGAGISTAASIPDYRGTNGVWTRMQQGKAIGNHDLSRAEPTVTHMALYALYKARVLKHIVSQNCDGLHLRSGIPRSLMSEVHGNMYVEVCRACKPSREYWRLFDVTEKTARYSHGTGRVCHNCKSALQDSIVHFGERGNLPWPINWTGASRAAKQADVILCLGSSLKVLKKYPWLWQMDRPVHKRSPLYIINLQWTPKDENAVLKINGRCDEVMTRVMSNLGLDIPAYDRAKDPIFYHAIGLRSSEIGTTTQPCLEEPIVEGSSAKIDEIGGTVPGVDDPDATLENALVVVEKPKPTKRNDNFTSIALADTFNGTYRAPFFTALPFLSMGLPFPAMRMYPHLTPLFYCPFLKIPSSTTNAITDEELDEEEEEEEDENKNENEAPLPNLKPACAFCMRNEGSLTCLYYQRIGDDPVTNAETITKKETDTDDLENITNSLQDAPQAIAKNPGWFGKGYRKGLRKKR